MRLCRKLNNNAPFVTRLKITTPTVKNVARLMGTFLHIFRSPVRYQGSTLGPLFFIFYINNVTRVIKSIRLALYADDTANLIASKNIEDLNDIMNASARDVLVQS